MAHLHKNEELIQTQLKELSEYVARRWGGTATYKPFFDRVIIAVTFEGRPNIYLVLNAIYPFHIPDEFWVEGLVDTTYLWGPEVKTGIIPRTNIEGTNIRFTFKSWDPLYNNLVTYFNASLQLIEAAKNGSYGINQ